MNAREKRLGLHLPVQVSGQDVANAPLAESTRSVNARAGAFSFESRHTLVVGSGPMLDMSLPEPLGRHFGGRHRASARFLAEVEG